MSIEQSQGIQALLAAERSATETIKFARLARQRRLKQAREEAETELDKFKISRENILKTSIKSLEKFSEEIHVKITKKTEEKLIFIEERVKKNREEASDLLTQLTLTVKPKVHQKFFRSAR
ncbi:V-type proton ATPase subunit G 1-like [Zophobas morio]|uniref:V-type proton ATPase subunit G 1-like n=1 Tax=Zophobas morio TaxID=2755281 RepID=UPI00308275CC